MKYVCRQIRDASDYTGAKVRASTIAAYLGLDSYDVYVVTHDYYAGASGDPWRQVKRESPTQYYMRFPVRDDEVGDTDLHLVTFFPKQGGKR